jgi:ADP-ribose pyrophosphatase
VKSNNAVPQSEGWETVSRETHFRNDDLEVCTEEIRTPARSAPRQWTVVHRKNGVVIAPMTAEGKIILIRQERIPIQTALWEVPAGQIDQTKDQDTDAIEAAALRELREETGFELAEGGELISLGDYFTSPGFTDERAFLSLARPVRPSPEGPKRDESESILDCRAFSTEELGRMIAANEIRDANTLVICARLVARGLLSLGHA